MSDTEGMTPDHRDISSMETDECLHASGDKNESDDIDLQTDEQSLEDTEFFILSKDFPDDNEDEKEPGSDNDNDKEFSIISEDSPETWTADDKGDHSDDNKDFSDKEAAETCAEDTNRNVCDFSEPCEDNVHGNLDSCDLQRTMDMYVNGSPRRQRRAFHRQKVKRIENLLRQDPVDLADLRQQAISHGGLLNAELRRKVWPLLANVNPSNITPKPDQEVLRGHRDYEQVVLDVNRSIKRFPPGMQENHRLSLQDKLVDVIMRVLVKHPELHYYQGYHDICVTFLLVVDEDMAYALVEKLSLSHLRDFLEPTMERTQQLLDYVPPLLRRANPELLKYLEEAELGNVFCISWLLTWFGHVLSDIESILRIFDFFIACHPLMPVYVMGAVVLHREKEIFATEQEMPALYQLLNKVPDNLPFEHLLSNAGDLYLQYPPTELANEALQRFKRAQEQAAARKARLLARQQGQNRKSSLLPDGNVTFSRVTFWMLGAVVSVAAYALFSSLEWDWAFSS